MQYHRDYRSEYRCWHIHTPNTEYRYYERHHVHKERMSGPGCIAPINGYLEDMNGLESETTPRMRCLQARSSLER